MSVSVRRDDVTCYMVRTCDGTACDRYPRNNDVCAENDRDVCKVTVTYVRLSIRNTFLVRDCIREVVLNIIYISSIVIYIS